MTQALYTAGTLLTLAGLALAAWSLFIAGRARGRVRCPGKGPLRRGCWYDLSGSPPDPQGVTTCPECGRRIAHRKDMLRTRRLWWPAAGGAAAVLLGLAAAVWPMVSVDQWHSAAPSTVLVLLADPDADLGSDPVWKELDLRARRRSMAAWQRRAATSGLATMILRQEGTDTLRSACTMARRLDAPTPAWNAALAERIQNLTDRAARAREAYDSRPAIVQFPPNPARRPDPRGELILAAGAARSVQSIPVLRSIMADPRDDRRVLAALALGAMNDIGSLEAMRAALVSESNDWSASRFAMAIGLLGPAASEALGDLSVLKATGGPAGVQAAEAAIGAITTPGHSVATVLASRDDLWGDYGLLFEGHLWRLNRHHGAIPLLREHVLSTRDDTMVRALYSLVLFCAVDDQTFRAVDTLAADPDPKVASVARQIREMLRREAGLPDDP